MTDYIWHWRNGNNIIYTRKNEIVKQAINKGLKVIKKKVWSNIIKFWYLSKNNRFIFTRSFLDIKYISPIHYDRFRL